MADTEHILLFGTAFLKLIIILLVTIRIIIITRLILNQLVWPAVKRTKPGAIDKIFHLLEIILPSFIILLGIQAAVRMFSESYSTYTKLINDSFFLIYLSIGTYIILSLISITSDWYLSRVHLYNLKEINLEEIDHRTVRSI